MNKRLSTTEVLKLLDDRDSDESLAGENYDIPMSLLPKARLIVLPMIRWITMNDIYIESLLNVSDQGQKGDSDQRI